MENVFYLWVESVNICLNKALEKSAVDTCRLQVAVYGGHVSSHEIWFQGFKDENFDVSDTEHERPPKRFEDAQLLDLLDEDPTQTLQDLL